MEISFCWHSFEICKYGSKKLIEKNMVEFLDEKIGTKKMCVLQY